MGKAERGRQNDLHLEWLKNDMITWLPKLIVYRGQQTDDKARLEEPCRRALFGQRWIIFGNKNRQIRLDERYTDEIRLICTDYIPVPNFSVLKSNDTWLLNERNFAISQSAKTTELESKLIEGLNFNLG